MSRTLYATLLSLFFIISCSENIQKEEKNNAIVKTLDSAPDSLDSLHSEQILKDDLKALSLFIAGDYLFTIQFESDTVYKVYSMPNLEPLGFLGLHGNGPNEWIAPRYSGDFEVTEMGTNIWIHDARKLKYRKINIEKSLNKPAVHVLSELSIHPKHGLSQFVLRINDNILVGNSGYDFKGNKRLKKYDIDKETVIGTSNVFPIMTNGDNIPGALKYNIFFDRLKTSEDKSRIVSVMNSFERIDIFDNNLNHLKSIVGDENAISFDYSQFMNEERRQKFNDVFIKNDNIYALFTPKLIKPDAPVVSSQIRVYSMTTGNLLKTYYCKEEIMGFDYHSATNTIYGVAFNNQKIIRFKLNEQN